jgi:hypothetical protein
VAQPVTIVQPLSEVYGTPQWLRATTNVVGNMLASAERDCSLVAEHAPELRRYCAENGIVWADFVAERLEARTDFVEYVERGVEVLRAAGRVGPIPTADAVEAGRALVEQTKPAASHGGERPGAGRPAKVEPEGEVPRTDDGGENQVRHDSLEKTEVQRRGAGAVVARLKRDSASDPRAAAMLEAVGEGKATPNAAAVALGWRKKKPTVQLDEAPDRAAARLVQRFGEAWCRDLVVALDAAVQRQGEGS